MALKDIKAKIGATKRMHTVTRAMEAVSAVKMRKTQEQALGGRPYARAALSILTRLSGSEGLREDALTRARPVRHTALVIITSDKGLAGALNSSVIKAAETALMDRPKENVRIFAIGRKGEEYFRRRGYRIETAIENKRDDVPLSIMSELSAQLTNGFRNEDFDEVVAVYSNFRSTFEQEAIAYTLLPLSIESIASQVRGIRPAKGKWSREPVLEAPPAYSVEPVEHAKHDAITVLIPRLVAASLHMMLLEAKASEHSARMVAMKNASDKSKEVARDLTRAYNKVRQAAITREVSEIVGGREALAA
jgi:F-type H+-transporting ATPase subunit gamma